MGCVKWLCRVTSSKLAGFAKGVNHLCYTSWDVLLIVLSNIWLRMEVDYGTELLMESACRQNQLMIHQQQLTLLCCNKQTSLTNQSYWVLCFSFIKTLIIVLCTFLGDNAISTSSVYRYDWHIAFLLSCIPC